MRFQGSPTFQHDSPALTGVLLTNLGTPAAPKPAALRRYLGEFLWDPRVVEVPRPLWWLILHGIILRLRPRRSAEAYAKIWTPEGSPLLAISRQQAEAVESYLHRELGDGIRVALGMRYGRPSIAEALETLREAGVRQLLVLPLYPQYSSATTGATWDALSRVLQGWRWLPDVRFISHYPDYPPYIEALANHIQRYWAQQGRPEKLLFSFHGIPRRTFLAGDPYYCECHKTARLVADRLELNPDDWQVVFQSRFGREEWLKPYTDHSLEALGQQGTRRVDVVCPGFAADCLETLEEIAMQNREIFLGAGGESFHYIPALNAEAEHISALGQLLTRHLRGWEQAGHSLATLNDAAAQTWQRAEALGAER